MTLLVKNWKPSNIYMAIFTTFPSLLAIEILGNGRFRSLKVDFAFFNRKKKIEFFGKNSTNILFHSSPHWHLPIFFLSIFAVFLHHWFFDFDFLCSFSSASSLTCSMLFFYNTIYATCFIFFSCKFSNDLHFSYLKFFITISPCLLISSIACKAKCTFFIFYFLSLSKHNASESLLNSIGFLFVHLIFIWFFFNFFYFFLPLHYIHLVFFFPKLVTHNVKSSRHYVLLVDMAIFFCSKWKWPCFWKCWIFFYKLLLSFEWKTWYLYIGQQNSWMAKVL